MFRTHARHLACAELAGSSTVGNIDGSRERAIREAIDIVEKINPSSAARAIAITNETNETEDIGLARDACASNRSPKNRFAAATTSRRIFDKR
jgi:hypothetical protein